MAVPRSVRWPVLTLCAVLTAATACTSSPKTPAQTGPQLDPRIQKIMDKPIYQHGQFGLLVVDPASGRTVSSLNPARLFVPGSTTKLFTVSTALDAFGSDHRTTTPLLTTGQVSGDTLTGALVLVASGDLTMGGRAKTDGTVDYEPVDHTYANAFPQLAALTPEDPLAGVDNLARQVRQRGITHVKGDVVVDSRLFVADPDLTTNPTPMMINDNVVDILSTPTTPGRPATLSWRPQTQGNSVAYHVMTVPKGQASAITTTPGPNGSITVTGTLAADAKPWLATVPIADPSAFARTAVIEAMQRAGVTVDATATGPDPAPPATAPTGTPLATLVSPPFKEDAKLILKVSLNVGADLMVCRLAVAKGSRNCEDGFASIKDFDSKAGVDPAQASQADGQGGVQGDAFTPQAFIPLLRYWTTRPEAELFRESLPILGVNGDLALYTADTPARGKVFAKTGTVAIPNSLNGAILVKGRAMAGYLDTGGGHYQVFNLVFNDTQAASADQILAIADDIDAISALLQQDAGTASPSGSGS